MGTSEGRTGGTDGVSVERDDGREEGDAMNGEPT